MEDSDRMNRIGQGLGIGLGVIGVIILWAGIFFVISAIIMVLWNGPVMNSLKQDSIKKIDYPTAMGLTFFFMLIMPSGMIIYNSTK